MKTFKSSKLLLTLIGLFILTTTLPIATQTEVETNNCFNCLSISSCLSGGQAHGWTACDYFPGQTPPDNCRVHGYDSCTSDIPGEGGWYDCGCNV